MPVTVPNLWAKARHPSRYMGDGRDASTQAATFLADFCNMVAGRRRKVLVARSLPLGDSVSGTADVAFYSLFRTSPSVTKVRCTMICAPANIASTVRPIIQWTVGGDAQTAIYVNRKNAGTVIPNDLFVISQDWTLDADTEYEAYCELTQYARIVSVCIWEPPQNVLTTDPSDLTSDAAIHPPAYAFGQMIHDVGIQDMQDTVGNLWKHQGAHMGGWSASDAALARTTTSTSFVNVFDSSFTAYDAAAPGIWTYPYRCGSLESTNVPVTCAFLFELSGATESLTFRFVTSAGTLCEITANAAVSWDWGSGSGNLLSSSTSQKVDLLWKVGAGDTGGLAGVSIFQYAT